MAFAWLPNEKKFFSKQAMHASTVPSFRVQMADNRPMG